MARITKMQSLPKIEGTASEFTDTGRWISGWQEHGTWGLDNLELTIHFGKKSETTICLDREEDVRKLARFLALALDTRLADEADDDDLYEMKATAMTG